MPSHLIICVICQEEFVVYDDRINRGVKYCSTPCRRIGEGTKKLPCVMCGKEVYRQKNQQKEDRAVTCSGACRAKYTASQNTVPLKERFFSKVTYPEGTECHVWIGSKIKHGYGVLCRGGKYGKKVLASRLAYEYAFGPFDQSLDVCHNCPGGDNPSCVNPAHLFLGTHQDNMNDMIAKKRNAYGEKAPWSKLTDEKVVALRQRYAQGDVSYGDLAKMYGVHLQTIAGIITRKRWKHI